MPLIRDSIKLGVGVTDALTAVTRRLFDDTGDLQGFVAAIAPSMTRAIARNDKARVEELKGQLEGLIEEKRLMAAWDAELIGTAMEVALDGIFLSASAALRAVNYV